MARGRLWKDVERARLLELHERGVKSADIASELGRSALSVRKEISRMRPSTPLTREQSNSLPTWSAEEAELLVKLKEDGMTPFEMAERMGRTVVAIRTRLKRLREGKSLVGRPRGGQRKQPQEAIQPPAVDQRENNKPPETIRKPRVYNTYGYDFSGPKLRLSSDRLELRVWFSLAGSSPWTYLDDLDLCASLLQGQDRNTTLSRIGRKLGLGPQDVLERFAFLTAPIRDERGHCDLDGIGPFLEVLSQEVTR